MDDTVILNMTATIAALLALLGFVAAATSLLLRYNRPAGVPIGGDRDMASINAAALAAGCFVIAATLGMLV